jgi:hypothetical protein
MKTIKFNTGRMYSERGQRIAAALLDSGDIYFVDIDRHIDGTVKANGLTKDEMIDFGMFTQRGVMAAYDANNYSWTTVPEGMRRELSDLAETL